jgi:hypothetical protein
MTFDLELEYETKYIELIPITEVREKLWLKKSWAENLQSCGQFDFSLI